VYDYGPWGSELKKNIRDYWWKNMTQMHENIVGVDAAIFYASYYVESQRACG
jgi:glycyl-tRNA synthetase